jgi:ABC-type lipoprotein release transport system permease subunit
MIQLIKMAYRDLGRNRRRSLLSALALGIGLALLLLMASVIAGELRGSLDSSIKLQSGNLQVRAKTFDENKTSLAWTDLVENPDKIAGQIAGLPQVQVATPRLYASGIVTAGDNSLGVRIMGIDPPSAANAPIQAGMVSGEFLKADDTGGILIGQPLADKLNLKTGDTTNLLVNTSNGTVDQQSFIIRGVYTTHTPSYDQSTVFMPLAKAQAITQTQNHASIIFVLLKNIDQTNAVAAALQGSQYQIMTYLQMNDLLVFERTREIGILSAIGMKSSSIMAMFFAESGMLGVGGIVMGLTLGGIMVAFFTKYGFYIGSLSAGVTGITLSDRIYAYMTPNDVITLTIVTFIVTLLAAVYPALLAARMEPVDALRGGKK